MRKTFILFCLLSFLFVSQAGVNYDDYDLVFKEDFNKTTDELLSSGDWTTSYPWGDGNTVKCFENVRIGCRSGVGCRKNIVDIANRRNLSIKDGKLHLRLKQNINWTSKDYDGTECFNLYEGAMLRSSYREVLPQDKSAASYATTNNWSKNKNAEDYKGFLYGVFEIDCIVPSSSAYYTAFWLYASRGTYPEIDVFEFDHVNDKQFTWYNNVHWHDQPGNMTQSRHKVKDKSVFEGMHTWTVDWNEDRMIFYIDGEEIRTFTDLPKDKSSWRKVDIILSLKATFKGKRSAYFKKNPKRFDENQAYIIDEVRVYKPKKK